MGRHDLLLSNGAHRVALATGLYASLQVQTAFGWQPVHTLGPGDLVMTQDDGLTPIASVEPELRRCLWSVRLPAGSVGNDAEIMMPPGQPIMVETAYAMPFSGDSMALVPATAMEGWRGIAAHVPAHAEPLIQVRLPRPAILFAGPGVMVGCEGGEPTVFDLKSLLRTPVRPVLPLAAARQLIAMLIAEEAGLHYGKVQAAVLRLPANRP